MIKIGSLILTLLLMGCGGGAGGESTVDKLPTTKGQEVNKEEEKKPLSMDENGKVITIKLSGSAESVAVSKDALFVAEGEDGIEVHKIGYDASVSSEFITKIDGINAKSVSLSSDGKKLHVINEEGFVNVFDITNISKPLKDGKMYSQSEIKKEVISKDGNYKFIPKNDKGLKIYDISNPSSKSLITTFNKSSAYDVVLADRDTKLLLAAGYSGINLLDITDPYSPKQSANFSLDGNIRGISLNEEQGLLFVANGDDGVLVYSLNVLLDKITKAK